MLLNYTKHQAIWCSLMQLYLMVYFVNRAEPPGTWEKTMHRNKHEETKEWSLQQRSTHRTSTRECFGGLLGIFGMHVWKPIPCRKNTHETTKPYAKLIFLCVGPCWSVSHGRCKHYFRLFPDRCCISCFFNLGIPSCRWIQLSKQNRIPCHN